MNKKFTCLIGIACVIFLVGCGTTNPVVTRSLVTTAVATGVTFGLERDPGAAPYLRAAAPVVCAAAAATNIQPAQIVSALESANLVATNSSAVLILNASLAIYDTIFESYGSNWVASQPVLQDYLGGVCDGINEGLATSPALKSKPHLTR